ncbi:MAG: hypothetical protein ABIT37_01000 [Luteolibacter sp.]
MMCKVRQTPWRRWFAPLVWLAVFQVFVIGLMASSSQLHEHFHADAHDCDHHCLSTEFQSGTIDLTVIVPVVAPDFQPVPVGTVVVSAEARHPLPHHLCGSLLEHGPPALA